MTLLLLLCCTALAREPQGARPAPLATEHHAAVLVSPIGPVAAGVSSALGTPAFDANLRVLHMPGAFVGWSAQADLLSADAMDLHMLSTTLKGGPRFALRKRGLEDWSLNPFASVGYTSVGAGEHHLAHYAVLGLGLDATRTWVWQRFTMELGLGVYSALPVGFSTPAEALANEAPVVLSPIKPSVTWSLGYAF